VLLLSLILIRFKISVLFFLQFPLLNLKVAIITFESEFIVFQLCEDKVLGRYYIASRSIKAGEVVLREPPLVQGPCQMTGPVCLGCLKAISYHSSEECPKCGWPLCRDPQCRESEHHTPECDWTANKRGKKVRTVVLV
jgi:hypothetical protein